MRAKIEGRGHICILGKTRYGKTYLANKLFQSLRGAGIYIDIEDKGEVKAKNVFSHTSPNIGEMEKIIRNGGKVRYVPSSDPEEREKEVNNLWSLLKRINQNCYVFVDELMHYGQDNGSWFNTYAVRGIKHGIHLVGITQRPQHVSNTIQTQTDEWVFFVMDFEERYMKDYNLPIEAVHQLKGKKYWFSIYSRSRGLSKPMRIK